MNAALLRSLNYTRSAFTTLIHLRGDKMSHLPVAGQFMSLCSLRFFLPLLRIIVFHSVIRIIKNLILEGGRFAQKDTLGRKEGRKSRKA